ncbi:MAG: flagellar basal body P-ring formation chaperone FlgA [Caldimonas sp.]
MTFIALLFPLTRVAPRAALRALAWAIVIGFGLAMSSLPSYAQDASARLDAGLVEQVRVLALGKAAEPGTPRIEVVVGQLDPRLHLAPCEKIEPYLPPNTRLWGKSRIGLRCTRGAVGWNVYLPITVKAWGMALVVRGGGSAGSTVSDADLDEAEVDLAEEASPALLDRKLVAGRTLSQSLRPGQTVRAAHIKARQWFAAGETVRIVASGAGFSLESVGQAVSNGVEGQSARVRTENGMIVTGLPTAERRMEFVP